MPIDMPLSGLATCEMLRNRLHIKYLANPSVTRCVLAQLAFPLKQSL